MKRKNNANPHATSMHQGGDALHWPAPHWLVRGAGHRVAWRILGAATAAAPPWVLLHGGPGSGCQPGMLAPFDLTRQCVIAIDQRGAGDSRPRARISANHLGVLVADLEALRQHLGIERWAMLAGSWGTVVALAYARQYPQHVARLVLRGAFGATRREIGTLLLPQYASGKLLGGAAYAGALWPVRQGMLLPSALARLTHLFHGGALGGAPTVTTLQAARGWQMRELRGALRGLRRALVHAAAPALLSALRAQWTDLQRQHRRTGARLHQRQATPTERQWINKYRIQAHYLRHRGFVTRHVLDSAVHVLAHHRLAVDWIHGRFDAVCPVTHSQRWAAMGAKIGGPVRLHRPYCGHLASEAPMRAVVRQCVE